MPELKFFVCLFRRVVTDAFLVEAIQKFYLTKMAVTQMDVHSVPHLV